MMAKVQPKTGFFKNLGKLLLGLTSDEGRPRPLIPNQPARQAIPRPWPGVVPTGNQTLAMDSNVSNMTNFAYAYGGWDQAGFMGYALLSELSQIVEFRRPAEILANEMTRKWGKLVSSSDDPDVKKKLNELEEDMKQFQVREVFNKGFELDNFFGIGHIFIDVGASDKDLISPLLLDPAKIGKGSLKAFRTIEPIWTYPNLYNADNPLNPDFYNPKSWFVMGKEVDKSRLLRFISRPIPDMLKPAYLFGGISLTQLMRTYVDNWLRTRQSVSAITSNFSTPVLETDMDQMTTTHGAQQLAMRAQIYNTLRDNQGLLVCDKEKEGFSIESAPLGGLDALQAQAIEQMSFPAGIPLVKLFGITPSGLNASSDGEVRTFYDSIASLQERIGSPQLKKVLDILQLNRYGAIDDAIHFEWAPLWELDEEKKSLVRKTEAEIDIIYVEGGIIDPMAVVDRLNADPESPYSGIDLGDPPEPELGEEGVGEEDPLDLSTLMGQVSAKTIVKSEERENQQREERDSSRSSSSSRSREPAAR